MFEFFRALVAIVAPVFVIATMLNVGLTQKPADILGHLRNWPFVLRMLLGNFVLVPLLAYVILTRVDFDLALKIGLFIFSLCAGAPFLIKLTQISQNDLALGAATMMLLVAATVVYVPIVLPRVWPEVVVDAGAIAQSLLLQMILPIIVGMLATQFLPGPARALQPWAARVGNYALYALLGATLIGYLQNMLAMVGSGAIFVGLVIVVAAFGIGYALGGKTDSLHDVGALGTAQRNTAAGVIIATQNFSDPNVLVIITVANTLGIILLLIFARMLSHDNPPATPAVPSSSVPDASQQLE
jgi:bile acid:Na+ symporter, BASS family